MPPKNPTTTARPLRSESHASDGTLRRDIARAAKKQLMARKMNPSAPAMKWTSPVVLIDVGSPSGVPGGNPSTGSAGKMAATIMPRPKPPRDHVTARDFGPSTRLNPDGGGEHHQPGEHEVRRLDPPARSVREQAERMPREVEAVPDEGLDQADREIERARHHAAAQQGPRDRRAAIDCPTRWTAMRLRLRRAVILSPRSV